MTNETASPAVARVRAGRHVATGAAWVAGGVLYVPAGLLHIDTGWRLDASCGLWAVADLLILAGLAGLWQLRPHGDSRIGAVALLAGIAARVALAGGESLSIVQGNDDNVLLPVGVMLTVAGLTVYGIVVARRRPWTGPSRFAPLALGVYPLVAMMPFAAASGEPPTAGIAGWGIPAVLVGLAALKHGKA